MRFLNILIASILSLSLSAQSLTLGVRAHLSRRGIDTRGLKLQLETPRTRLFTTPTGAFVLTNAESGNLIGYGSKSTGLLPLPLRIAMNWGTAEATAMTATKAIPPLLTTRHSDAAPYNRACPRYLSTDSVLSEERCHVGCVATALEQIVTYYRRPLVLTDTLHGWKTTAYEIPDIFPGTSVATADIADAYDLTASEEETDAVARLGYICAVAAHMRFGLSESGASVWRLEETVKRAFGYPYAHYVDSYYYSADDWRAMILAELGAGRPVLYAGYTEQINGHAFVVDGVDEDGLFHINWGYGGDYNGYFDLSVLNYAEPRAPFSAPGMGFFCNHEALLLSPDSVEAALPDTLERQPGDLLIDSLVLVQPPATGKITEARIYATNTTDHRLTTTYELFVNEPTDSAYFAQGLYLSLTGLTLSAGESGMCSAHLTFPRAGEQILRMSSDDINIAAEQTVVVADESASRINQEPPTFTFLPDGTVEATVTYRNLSDEERTGVIIIYSLATPERPLPDHESHYSYLYMEPGGELTDTVRFTGLEAARNYLLRIRLGWPVISETPFTMPDETTSIGRTSLTPSRSSSVYDLTGRRLTAPPSRGIYIKGGRKLMNIEH